MLEIERKFLIPNSELMFDDPAFVVMNVVLIKQLYLYVDDQSSVRLRTFKSEDGVTPLDEWGCLSFKSKSRGSQALIRDENELAIPYSNIEDMFKKHLSHTPILFKRRYTLFTKAERPDIRFRKWEVDHFLNIAEPFYMAEIELQDENDAIIIPQWCDKEVTHDPNYKNSAIAKNILQKPIDTQDRLC